MATILQGKRASGEDAAESINPATGEFIERFPYQKDAEVERTLRDAAQGFQRWRDTPIEARATVLRKMAGVLRANSARYAEAMTREMGKLLGESQAEVEKCAKLCDWFAEHGPLMLADEKTTVTEAEVYVSYLPLGTILGIMPWNFPFWQAMRAGVPILMGGNGFLLKHAPNVMRCAHNLEEAWREAGLPQGAFTNLNVGVERIESIVSDARIAGVTLTGSRRAGGAVAAAAGKVRKKSVLELGGSDPFIVLADADIESAVDAGITSRYGNCGQVCIAAKRFLLDETIAESFIEGFVAKARALKIGDPMQPETQLGPLARADLRDNLDQQVRRSIGQGARLLCGGRKIDGKGFFYEPTVLTGVAPGMAAFDEETFGPLAAMTMVHDAEEAVILANRNDYGLSSNVWTRDLERARKMACRLETGAVFINGFSASDPRAPIGGVKNSGYGRELSHFGIHEFTNAQAVWVRP